MASAKLTDLAARNAKPRGKVHKLAAGRGLCLVVMPTGAKYWWLRYRFAGIQKTLSLGVYPEITLRQAEAKVDEARAQLRDGIDPSEARRSKKFALRIAIAQTFGDAAEKWVTHSTPRWRPATLKKVRHYLDKDLLPALGKRPLSAITPPELSVILEKLEGRNAFNVAKKTRQWLAKIFEFAIAKGLTTSNPAEHLNAVAVKPPEAKNHAHLTLDELPAFLRALEAYPGSTLVKGATWMALWTANRPGVTRTLRWDEINLDEALWTIAKGREGMKKGYSHLTPLPHQAVTLLRELQKKTGKFDYVFVGRNDPRKPMSDGAVNVMLKKLGYGGRQTAHGFRHLISTSLNERGFKPDWVERQLAHGDPDAIRDTYNKAHYLAERRTMMQAWADTLDSFKQSATVVPLRKASGTRR